MTLGFPEALLRAEELAAQSERRVVLGICGSPGAGKTLLAERLVAGLNRRRPGSAAHVPMDGFHLADSTLERLGRRERKGAPDTFDGWGYAALLERLGEGGEDPVYAPDFERDLEEPIAGSIEVPGTARVVVSEGNYLLLPDRPWSRARAAFSEVWFCVLPDELRMRRLVARHMRFGRNERDAAQWAEEVDGPNARLIEQFRHTADLEVSTAEVYTPAEVIPETASKVP
ncbi:nucleoside/nucleotide kinase family protein [Amnibacterium endophyticum]|uniref:Nucleoside/nucleotide kinase family protein n=1 Tax=Amnibacterium endophyticum TaxID=2109337 RepID=A0ABW4LB79_9MICO